MNRKENPSRSKSPPTPSAAPSGPGEEAPEVNPEYVLRLFVSGFTPRSQRAIDNLRNICERYLAGRYRSEVIDLYQSPGLAHDEQIIATPTLVKARPFPAQRVIGDLSQVDKVLHGLDIK
jgi:circadian clock protein KaiB